MALSDHWAVNTIVIASYWDLVIWAREQIYNNNRNNIYETHLEIDVRLSERWRRETTTKKSHQWQCGGGK